MFIGQNCSRGTVTQISRTERGLESLDYVEQMLETFQEQNQQHMALMQQSMLGFFEQIRLLSVSRVNYKNVQTKIHQIITRRRYPITPSRASSWNSPQSPTQSQYSTSKQPRF